MATRAFLWKRTCNGMFYVTSFADGKKRYQSLGTKDKLQAQKLFEQLTNTPAGKQPPETLQQSNPYLLSTLPKLLPSLCSDLSQRTIEGCYETGLKSLQSTLKDMAIQDLTPAQIEQWKLSMMRTHSPVTINIYLRHLKALANRLMAIGVMTANPFKKVKTMKVPFKQPLFLQVETVKLIMAKLKARVFRGLCWRDWQQVAG